MKNYEINQYYLGLFENQNKDYTFNVIQIRLNHETIVVNPVQIITDDEKRVNITVPMPKIHGSEQIKKIIDRIPTYKNNKTKFCNYSLNDYCSYKNNCNFAHSIEELNLYPINQISKYKIQECTGKNHNNTFICNNQILCLYSHEYNLEQLTKKVFKDLEEIIWHSNKAKDKILVKQFEPSSYQAAILPFKRLNYKRALIFSNLQKSNYQNIENQSYSCK